MRRMLVSTFWCVGVWNVGMESKLAQSPTIGMDCCGLDCSSESIRVVGVLRSCGALYSTDEDQRSDDRSLHLRASHAVVGGSRHRPRQR